MTNHQPNASSKGPEYPESAVLKRKNSTSEFNTEHRSKKSSAFDMGETKSFPDTQPHDSGRPATQNPFGSATKGSESPETTWPESKNSTPMTNTDPYPNDSKISTVASRNNRDERRRVWTTAPPLRPFQNTAYTCTTARDP